MRRRDFIAGIAGSAAAWPVAAKAQRVRRIGVLMGYDENDRRAQTYISALLQGLVSLGWSDGGNVKIDVRWAGGDVNQMSLLAKDLIDLQPDLIFANTTPVTAAVARETHTIPIIFATVSDPVGAGFVESLSRPGRNITGYINVEAAMGGKWLQLLKDVVPRVQRVGVFYNPPTAPGDGRYFLPSVETVREISRRFIDDCTGS
jgi:putative tryptophan/tyrosine transport system substrate-binding protein